MFGLGVLITAILTTLTPFAADTSVWFLVALRVLEGLSEVRKLYSKLFIPRLLWEETIPERRVNLLPFRFAQSLMVYTLSH